MFLLQILCSYILSFKISYFKYVYSGDILELICPIYTFTTQFLLEESAITFVSIAYLCVHL